MNKSIRLKKIIFLVIAIVFVFNLVKQGKTMNRIAKEKQQQEIKLENLQQDTQRLKEENDKAQTDEYLEKLAREKLSMIKNGEFSVVNKTSK
ncbi:FtsB family cell division protein [Clostridium sp. HCP1S3_B4]|uniref:FtsB family cell division protein n=1 Tax=unclassified Clostridium TaxID=2614128 RepID=UPI00169AFD6D|nr:septum formation initiator family protein [Clostridiales bacterium]MDY2729797.1 septum formation initiator family protein [Clostridium sp.]NLK23872.1 septum formation initiator family protein [Clostridiales bacterium]